MQGVKEKVKDVASTAKAKMKEKEAMAEEKMEKASAHSEIEKEIAHQRAKAKVAEAKMEMHAEKVQHREESIMHHVNKNRPHGYGAPVNPTATAFPAQVTPATSTFPSYPATKKY